MKDSQAELTASEMSLQIIPNSTAIYLLTWQYLLGANLYAREGSCFCEIYYQ